jgi:hypothetical protein
VASPFRIRFAANVPLDDPSTGEHHVHLCFDGADCDVESQYTLVYGELFEVTGLGPGEHTIEASLRNADHTDAGPSDTITIAVGEGGAASTATPSPQDDGGGYGD